MTLTYLGSELDLCSIIEGRTDEIAAALTLSADALPGSAAPALSTAAGVDDGKGVISGNDWPGDGCMSDSFIEQSVPSKGDDNNQICRDQL
jgi:hypothetical protein